MPRFIMIALMLGSLALMPACGGDEGDGSGSGDAGADSGGDNGGDGGGDASPKTDTREQTVEALLGKMNQFPEILSGVKDNASADAATGKLKDLAESIKPLVEKWSGFGEMTDDEASSIESKYKQQIIGFEDKLKEQITRITGENPLLMAKLQEGMSAIKDALGDFDIDG